MDDYELTEKQKKDLIAFYTTFDLTKVKDVKHLENEILYQLYKKPFKSKVQPHFDIYKSGFIHQVDILYLPSDAGFKYGLTIVDLGNRKTDCIPLKSKSSQVVAKALETAYNKPEKERILSKPERIEADDGSEFKGQFKTYCDNNKIAIKYAEPFRSRQLAVVESRNGEIAKPLLRRMLAEEIITKKVDRKWVHFLPSVLIVLNERYGLTEQQIKKLQKEHDKFIKLDAFNANLLNVGDNVRTQLDKPIDHTTGKRLTGSFRQGDVRWSKPTTIEQLKLIPNQVPLYKVKGRTCWYSKDQLQVIQKENEPPSYIKITPANRKK
ncbi:MAG TPA: transposase family protein [Allocoleopsis sp.]